MSLSQYTNLNLLGHLALDLANDNSSSGTLNDVPTKDVSFIRFTSNSEVIVNGFDPDYNNDNNKLLIVSYTGTNSLTLKHSASGSTPVNRIQCPLATDVVLTTNSSIILIYDSYSNFWRLVSGVGGGNAVGTVLDTYINSQKATINDSSTTTLNSIFSETITGIYYFWISSDPRIKGNIAIKSDDLTNSSLESFSSTITAIQDNASTLNIYISGSDVVFQNNTGSQIVLVVRRETTPSVGGSTGISNLTIGTGLTGSLYNGTSNVTIAIDSTVTTLTGNQTLTNKTLSSPTLNNPSFLGNIKFGGTTFAKTGSAGDATFDNGTTDTPGILLYYDNNKNFGIDSYYNGTRQVLRFVKDLNETGGAVIGYFDDTGNLVTNGFLNPLAWKPGQVIQDVMLSNTEVTVVSTTIAGSTSNVDFITYNYTPISSSSYLMVHIHISKYFMADVATGNESWYSVLKVDGNEVAYGFQKTTNAFRTGTLFPLTGRYTNTSTSAKTIAVAARRDTSDDSFTIDNSATAIWLRITEVAR